MDNNFVNTVIVAPGSQLPARAATGTPAMPAAKSMSKLVRAPAAAKSMPNSGPKPVAKPATLRKTPPPRRAGQAMTGLGILNEHLGYFVRRLQVWIFQDFIRHLSSIDISPAQFSVLVVIDANSGLSQSELAATLGIERARLVRLLHRLEQRTLTQRLPSSNDGRRHALRLTRDGKAILTRAKTLAAQHETELKDKIGAERHRLLLEALREF